MNLFIDITSGKARPGIYSSISGRPGNLVSQTEEITQVNGWNSSAIALSQNLVSGVTYRLAIELNSSSATIYVKCIRLKKTYIISLQHVIANCSI